MRIAVAIAAAISMSAANHPVFIDNFSARTSFCVPNPRNDRAACRRRAAAKRRNKAKRG